MGVEEIQGPLEAPHRIEEAMFPSTASPATALTIAAMMNDEDIAAARARRVAYEAKAARRAAAREAAIMRRTSRAGRGRRRRGTSRLGAAGYAR